MGLKHRFDGPTHGLSDCWSAVVEISRRCLIVLGTWVDHWNPKSKCKDSRAAPVSPGVALERRLLRASSGRYLDTIDCNLHDYSENC